MRGASYLLPSSLQKRLLRYALSRLDLLDTEALDLENLDVVWGRRSVVELRDVGLRLKKISSLLQFPQTLNLRKARILLLRITIPADIYSSGIVVEVEGVDIQAQAVARQDSEEPGESRDPPGRGHDQGRGGNQSNSTTRLERQSSIHDPSGDVPDVDSDTESEGEESGHLPTTEDLANSFLQAEPLPEKAELQAAITLQSHNLDQSVSSDGEGGEGTEEEPVTGTGTALSLPGFLAGFLKGVGDRLEIRVREVGICLDVELRADASPGEDGWTQVDRVAVQLKVQDVDIEGVTSEQSDVREKGDTGSGEDGKHKDGVATDKSSSKRKAREGRRSIKLRDIQGVLISEATLFDSLTRLSAPPSPDMMHSKVQKDDESLPSREDGAAVMQSVASHGHLSNSSSLEGSPENLLTQSTFLQPTLGTSGEYGNLEESVATSDGSRFADAGDEDEIEETNANKGGPLPSNDLGGSFLDDSAFLDQVSESRFDDGDLEDEDGLQNPPSRSGSASEVPAIPVIQGEIRGPATQAPPLHGSDSIHNDVPPNELPVLNRVLRSAQLPPIRSLDNQGTEAVACSEPALPRGRQHLKSESEHGFISPREECHESYDSSEDSDEIQSSAEEDLAESRIFSHEEAESMYMSALSHASSTRGRSLRIAGGWESSDSESSDAEVVATPQQTRGIVEQPLRNPLPPSLQNSTMVSRSQTQGGREMTPTPERQATSRLFEHLRSSPTESLNQAPTTSGLGDGSEGSGKSSSYSRVEKRMLTVDEITLWLPSPAATSDSAPHELEAFPKPDLIESNYQGIPGAFSTHALQSTTFQSTRKLETHAADPPKGKHRAKVAAEEAIQEPTGSSEESSSLIEVDVGTVTGTVDISVGRIMFRLVQQLLAMAGNSPPPDSSQAGDPNTLSGQSFKMRVENISLQFLEHLTAWATTSSPTIHDIGIEQPSTKHPESDTLLRTTFKGVDLSFSSDQESSTTLFSIEKFHFGYAKEDILSFDADLRMRASTRDLLAPVDKDISLSLTQTPMFRKLNLTTLPVLISLDLQRLDETFSWFGGFSSILGLGSLTASNATITGVGPAATKSPKRSRGVHFEASQIPGNPVDAHPHTQMKANARIGGITVELIGKDCSISLNTTALRLVSREEGLGLQIDKARVSGPHLRNANHEGSVLVDIGNTRVEYLSTPKEADLTRLLSLLTPSKNKYGQDDDILLDTLIRQRQQGPVLRITLASISGGIASVEDLRVLPNLGEEIAKLSTVTKYLPEDERPGILTLALVREMNFHITINDGFGELQLGTQNLDIAHVSLPSLLALGIGKVQLRRNSVEELLGEGTPSPPPTSGTQPLMIMARMIGDELEPTVRVKLWNIRIEYSVPTALAATGLSETMTGEEAVADMVESIATLMDRNLAPGADSEAYHLPTSSGGSNTASKPLRVEVFLQDCMVGLNPLDIPSKGLVVLTETRLSGIMPQKELFEAVLEIHKASLLIIDDTKNILPIGDVPISTRRQSFDYGSRQVSDLCRMGFVSVSYISSAKAIFKLLDSGVEGEKCVDLELRDDLLVLESCADSTQTLLSIMNGLKPPTPPSQDIRYRTEIVPVEDMLASLSGDAFAPSAPTDSSFPLSLDEGDMVDDDVPRNLEFVESFYRPESEPTSEEIADSLLEDDLGQLASPPRTRELGGKVLLESFREQYSIAPNEPLEFREDYFGLKSSVEGTAHKWNSVKNTYSAVRHGKVQGSPLRVRVRDVHIIWNMFDGYDWQKTRETISKAVKEVEVKAIERQSRNERRVSFDLEDDEESVIGDFLFNSIYIGIPANRDPRELSNQINRNFDDLASETESYAASNVSHSPSRQSYGPRARGKRLKLDRSKHHKIAFELKGVSADLVVFPPGTGETQSSLDVRVRDLEIFDHVPTSTWKKFVTYMHDAGERESGSSMVHLEILNVKPIPDLAASEIVVKATILPLRLHVDQDALDLITRFFEFKDDAIPIHASPADVPFLQRVEVNAVKVKLDYKPKTVDYAGLRSGHTTEFMNFFILDEADMVLRHVIIYGVSGFDKLSKTLNDIWMPDIKQNQLPGVLAGLAPVRSLVNVGGGVRDLVVVPMREYRKDGRVVRSIQKGALAFAKTTTSELVKLGAKLAIGTQTVLQGAEGFLLNPGQRGDSKWEGTEIDEDEKKAISLYADQPVGVRQGLRGAYASLERDLLTARDAIIAVPGEVMDSGSAQGAARVVLKRAPTVIFRPVIGASKAISQTLMGATNSLDPQHRRRIEDKYKKH
ncbi:MAG: autophagy- protein 2 [Geoglossum umbratile]|nr:MAG: autophagy- protein 2 [Geoglossum umbratile]